MSDFLPRDFTGIQLVQLQVGTGTHPLFRELTAQFPQGGITALIGPNGSGKSTLLRIMAGLIRPRHGQVLYQGQAIDQHRSYQLQLGYVPAVPALYPHLTVVENFRICATLKKIPNQHHATAMTAALQQCELDPYQKVLFGKLSEGLKKRVMLASQLIHQPHILLLDEPCAELDPLQRQQLWTLLAKLSHPQRLIVLSSHHPQEIHNLCNKMYFFKQGKLTPISHEQAFSQLLWQRSTPTTETMAGVTQP